MRVGAAGPPDDPDDPRINAELLALIRAQADRVAKIANEAVAGMALAPVTEATQAQLAAAMAPIVRAAQAQIELALPKFEFPALPTFVLPPDFIETLARARESRPPNWPESMDYARLEEVIQGDGLPLVWVPRRTVVEAVLAAPDRPSRVEVLLDFRAEVIRDCREVLATISTPTFAGKVVLAGQAVNALEGGHSQAAQALAVVVIESATRSAIHRNSTTVKHRVKFDIDKVQYVELRLRAALAPLASFYKEWSDKAPEPCPDALSRHVTCHQAEPQHFTDANALVAVLLATSVLRGLQELEELQAATGDPTWPWK